MSHLVRSLSTDINMLTDFEVDKIERTVDGYILKSSRNQQKVIHARYLVLAAPPCSLQGILAIAEPALSDMLKEFKPVPVESVGIFLDKAIAGIQEVGVVIGRNEAFYSIVSMDPYDGKLPLGRRFTFHFRPGLLSLEQKMQIIRRVLNLREAQILDHYEKTSVFVSIPLHYKELLARIEQICTVKPLFLTGNYFEGVSLEDCVSRSVHEFDRLKRMERMDGLL
jgi:protoporphyrinogen oxidase